MLSIVGVSTRFWRSVNLLKQRQKIPFKWQCVWWDSSVFYPSSCNRKLTMHSLSMVPNLRVLQGFRFTCSSATYILLATCTLFGLHYRSFYLYSAVHLIVDWPAVTVLCCDWFRCSFVDSDNVLQFILYVFSNMFPPSAATSPGSCSQMSYMRSLSAVHWPVAKRKRYRLSMYLYFRGLRFMALVTW